MANSINENLTAVLKTDPRFVNEDGELIKAAVIDRAWKIDRDLVRLLIVESEIRTKFFEEIDGHWIFDINIFIEFISDKNFLANSYTRFRNRIGLNTKGKFLREWGEVSLVWPYKDCVLEGGQTTEEEKRKEVFFNETLAQDEIDRLFDLKVLTHWKRYSIESKQKVTKIRRNVHGTIRENLIIKGNNLLALHTLKKQFRNRVKLIYIDPPYNTGSDSFGYNDHFNHSSWLTFMKNRMEVAKELMRDDGVIFIHIDDQEMHYLKVMADEIFGRNNFVATIPRKTRSGKSDVPYKLSQDFDWMLVYTNSASKNDVLFSRTVTRKYHKTSDFPDDEWRLTDLTTQRTIHERPNSDFTLVNPKNGQEFPVNPNRCWGVTKDSVDGYLKRNKIVFPSDYNFLKIKQPAMRVFKSEEIESKGEDFNKAYVSSDFLNHTMDELLKSMFNKKGTDEIVSLFGSKVFAYPKPELLIQRIIEYATQEGDIVLDFHAGSGTTCAVAHKMNRQYIGIEQMDYVNTITIERLKKVIGRYDDNESSFDKEIICDTGGISNTVNWQGGGDFIYCELMKYNETYMERIQAAKSSEELVAIFEKIAVNSFLKWYVNIEHPDNAIDEFKAISSKENGLDIQKKLLAELLDKNQLYVNLSEIDDEDFGVLEEDKVLNDMFFSDVI